MKQCRGRSVFYPSLEASLPPETQQPPECSSGERSEDNRPSCPRCRPQAHEWAGWSQRAPWRVILIAVVKSPILQSDCSLSLRHLRRLSHRVSRPEDCPPASETGVAVNRLLRAAITHDSPNTAAFETTVRPTGTLRTHQSEQTSAPGTQTPGYNVRFRILCNKIITHKMFDHIVLVIIFLNCITIAMERPRIDPTSASSSSLSNYIFTAIFVLR
ncbi:voltage-dependent T-type calcium channel subunit alpha-1G-like protein [Lates japonicus]|uniref:Voltage-dependent T-type calcium channel subunit alpha-1G-like protein n=1 Tax=Lates japonicus TaxID=270547 RepID=A0AAD3NME4_LATJO|nr:voltage-dependent T-type calcium channel subunit alpha-1G-like protein [Lates japonicus]